MGIAEVWKGFNPFWLLYGWFGVEVLGLGMLAMSTGLSVPWAKLNWDDPKRMLSWQTAVLTLVSWFALGAIGGLVLCMPVLVELFNTANTSLIAIMMLICAVVTAMLAGGAAYAVLRLGMIK